MKIAAKGPKERKKRREKSRAGGRRISTTARQL
jgi:hypothetical protein